MTVQYALGTDGAPYFGLHRLIVSPGGNKAAALANKMLMGLTKNGVGESSHENLT